LSAEVSFASISEVSEEVAMPAEEVRVILEQILPLGEVENEEEEEEEIEEEVDE
jgi:hypothetical protein